MREPNSENLGSLETEQRNPRTTELDRLQGFELVSALHAENFAVAEAVAHALPEIAVAVEQIRERLQAGGRLFYVGAGTSGRLGVLDASECPPTFGVPRELVQGVIAGGERALTTSIEGAEDSPEQGAEDLKARGVTALDVVCGIAASGRTPYVMGALDYAKRVGAYTVAVVNVSSSRMATLADVTLCAVTGAEAVTGSTRLKAGTAQKMILNLLTTAVMVRLGKVYGNLMVDVRATNFKLKDRALRIVVTATGSTTEQAESALQESEGEVKTAIVMLTAQVDVVTARRRLLEANGWVRVALDLPK